MKPQIVLFDFNGTLGKKKGGRLRPGLVEALQRLRREGGVQIGLWTNAQARNLPLAKLKDLGVEFDLVLTGNECVAPNSQYLQAHPSLDRWDKLKIISQIPGAILVDDTPAKIPESDHHLLWPIPTWNGKDQADDELTKMVTRLLKSFISKDGGP